MKAAAKVAETNKAAAAKAASEAKLALEPVSIYISRATQKLYVRRNTHKPAAGRRRECSIRSIEVPITIRDPGKRIGTHVFTAMARGDAGLRWSAVTIDNGDDAEERARPHHHPEGCARPHRADRVAAILDHHLGRAVERGDQLPHRVRRGAEQPAAGRLHHAPAYRGCGDRSECRRRLLFPARRLGLAVRQFPAQLGMGLAARTAATIPNRFAAQRRFPNWVPAREPRNRLRNSAAGAIRIGSPTRISSARTNNAGDRRRTPRRRYCKHQAGGSRLTSKVRGRSVAPRPSAGGTRRNPRSIRQSS